jgi:hypothetical protein
MKVDGTETSGKGDYHVYGIAEKEKKHKKV